VRYLDGCEYRSVRQGSTTSLARWTSQISAGEETLATVHRWEVDTQAAETDDTSTARIHYLVGDHLGSVSFELDESAQVISYEEHLAYGGTAFVLGDAAREVGLRQRKKHCRARLIG
jgi:sugar/nucleoside kinase (ribokinase family)